MTTSAVSERVAPSGWILAGALAASAVALRLPGLDAGFSPDELANVHPGGWWAILVDPESAVNPPLVRWLGNLPVDDGLAPRVGRLVSLAASAISVVLTFALTGRATGSLLAAGVAGALVAWAPMHVVMSARFRAYALWTLWANVHLLALTRRLDGDRGPLPRHVAMASAVLLAWTHYLTVPVFGALLLALRLTGLDRDAWRLWVPAAVSLAPLGLRVVSTGSTRVAPAVAPWDALPPILSLDLPGAEGARAWGGAVAGALGLGVPWRAWPLALPLLLAVAAVALTLRGRPRSLRLLVLGAGAVVASVLGMGLLQLVRSPIGLMWWVFAAPCLAALVTAPRHPLPRLALTVGLAWALGAHRLPGTLAALHRGTGEAALQQVAARWGAWDDARGGAPVFGYPDYVVTGLHFYLAHLSAARRHAPDPPCDTVTCFVHDGVTVRSLADRRGAAGLVVAIEEPPPADAVGGCVEVERAPALWVLRCDAAPTPTDAR